MKIRLVCATRSTQEAFFEETALGRSFALYRPVMPLLEIFLFADNAEGLSSVYNKAIEYAVNDPAILVFVHDDVYLNDFYWGNRLRSSLDYFDIIGVVGNKRRSPRQASWYFLNNAFLRDEPQYLSGIVGHGKGFPVEDVSVYGDSGQECKLLDGLLIAANSETLIKHHLRFDPQFEFHFYDMDFCRQAELKGLKMGTCPISVIHESAGAYNQTWQDVYKKYLAKYGE